ncbi:acyl-phosphate glycerol 3-phosphate acyltransferase [Nakamurella antarctica]|uniref:Acyl-phosphate glycerol 3-phosphate acyltransferase n=1 Tax=Nakamurella antarctica TaxID=1902245 RepID=A0A3G8ZVA4_9ACTN|nr:1-acyl-sn-glycerol-3-phosphate acyltransferase [Nakamurella antarctica]AZI57621.1 acyl-phosphate glycerol 3-phosphate acyltransferase [Nakamurella antarctica]
MNTPSAIPPPAPAKGARAKLVKLAWKLSRWHFVGEVPSAKNGILLGAPHTSNWDYVVMLAITWRLGLTPKFLGKQELFSGPMGFLARATGGIPVDRKDPSKVVSEIVSRVEAGDQFYLVVAAEGTRARGDYWKSGFYRIALETGMPITLGFVDRTTKSGGLGPSFMPTGNVGADMDLIRAYYADKFGIHPKNRTEPRLRDESGRAGDTPPG